MWTKIYLFFVLGLISFEASSHVSKDKIKKLCEESLESSPEVPFSDEKDSQHSVMQRKQVTGKIYDREMYDQETYDWIMAIIKNEADYHKKKDYYETIVDDRLFSFSPLSLDDIAKKFGVSRQTVFLDASIVRAMIRGRFLESNENFSEEQKEQILSLVAKDTRVKKGRLAKELGVSYQKIRLITAELRGKNLLAWVGPKKEGFWEILKKGEEPSVYEPKKEEVWFLMRQDPEISKAELMKVVGISISTLERIISRLKDEGRLVIAGTPISARPPDPTYKVRWEALQKGEVPSGYNPKRERKKRVWSLIAKNPRVSRGKLAEDIGVSKRTIDNITKELKEEGYLIRVGATNGYWIASNKRRRSLDYNLQEEREEIMLYLMVEDPHITMAELAKKVGVARSTIIRIIKILKEKGRLVRNGSWQVFNKEGDIIHPGSVSTEYQGRGFLISTDQIPDTQLFQEIPIVSH